MNTVRKIPYCTTVRVSSPCLFMDKKTGCQFPDKHCHPIVPNCKGEKENCKHIIQIETEEYCNAYMNPNIQWEFCTKCPLETHIPKKEEKKKGVLDTRKAAKHHKQKG